jgi:hypothetical protein
MQELASAMLYTVENDYQKNIIEGKDIIALAKIGG